MADYWIKLYIEILDDPKMATLPDRLWRRIVELFLLSGRLYPDKSGRLPNAQQIAWSLRLPTDDVLHDLEQIASTGIIVPTTNGWLIPAFAARQAAASNTERVRAHRERKRKEQYYGNTDETNLERNVSQSRAEQSRTEQSRAEQNIAEPARPSIFDLYEGQIGMLTPIIAERLIDAEKTYPPDWIAEAFREAAENNAHSWRYVEAILMRWQRDGFKSRGGKSGKGRANPPAKSLAETFNVATAREMGMSDDQIRAKLRGYGCAEAEIDARLEAA